MSTGLQRAPSRLVRILQFASLAVWFGSLGLFLQYSVTRPRCPDPAIGRVYSINNHGRIAYLARSERLLLDGMQTLAALLMGLAFVVYYRSDTPRRVQRRW
jgi:hypothetical protein